LILASFVGANILHAVQENVIHKRKAAEAAIKKAENNNINYSKFDVINKVKSMDEAKEYKIVRPGVPAVIASEGKMTLLIHDVDFNKLPDMMQLKFGEAIWVLPPPMPGRMNGYYIHPILVTPYMARVFQSYNPETNTFNFSPPEFESTIESKYGAKELDEKVFGFTNYGWGQSPPQMSFL
jgi:hypothetical protein